MKKIYQRKQCVMQLFKTQTSQEKQLTEDKHFSRLRYCQRNIHTAWHKISKLSQLLKIKRIVHSK